MKHTIKSLSRARPVCLCSSTSLFPLVLSLSRLAGFVKKKYPMELVNYTNVREYICRERNISRLQRSVARLTLTCHPSRSQSGLAGPGEGVKGGTAIRENMALYLNLCLTSRHKGQFDDTGKPDIIFEPMLDLGRGIESS